MSKISDDDTERIHVFASGSIKDALYGAVRWTEALHDRGELKEPLTTLITLLQARWIALLRLHMRTTTAHTVATVSRGGRGAYLPETGIAFSQYLFGCGIGQARQKSVWYLSEIDLDPDEYRVSGHLPFANGQNREVVAVMLERGARVSDLLEIHFTRWLSVREKKSLSILAAVLSEAWQHRRANLVADALAQSRRTEEQKIASLTKGSVLGAANPAGLSKAEYRVCVLLANGLNAKAIGERLRISESTVRSHLRSIYAKTSTSGQCKLMHLLLK